MKNLDEKTLATESILRGKFLNVERDRVLGPDGREYFREYILHPGAAMMIPLLSNGNVVMVNQYRYSVKKTFLEFPAGKRDEGEATLQTAQRELKEETGYEAKDWKLITTIHPVIGYSNEFIDIYLAKNLVKKEAQPEQGEFLEVKEVHPQELMKQVRQGQVSDVKTQIGAFWLEKILAGEWG